MTRSVAGVCRLCNVSGELRRSHVWPKFVYRRYITDPKGGGALQLSTLKITSYQHRRHWFCNACETRLSVWEGAAARLCDALEAAPETSLAYDTSFLPFAVSVSLRSLLSEEETDPIQHPAADAAKLRWRRFLLGRAPNEGLYTQHVFAVHSPSGLHKMVGGRIRDDAEAVFSQLGPLLILGLLGRRSLSAADRKVWNRTQVLAAGGVIEPVSTWRVGGNITRTLARSLAEHEAEVAEWIRAGRPSKR